MAYNLIIETQITGVIMATKILMRDESGNLKEGFVGWSWTTFFFGCLPALFRGDFGGFFVILGISLLAQYGVALMGVPELAVIVGLLVKVAWAANYNGWHMDRLKGRGFVLINGGA